MSSISKFNDKNYIVIYVIVNSHMQYIGAYEDHCMADGECKKLNSQSACSSNGEVYSYVTSVLHKEWVD